jgi:hypothetical protein
MRADQHGLRYRFEQLLASAGAPSWVRTRVSGEIGMFRLGRFRRAMTQLVPWCRWKLSPPSGITEARGQDAELLIVLRLGPADDLGDLELAEACRTVTPCDLLSVKNHGDPLHLIHMSGAAC